jgi:hypothetical protein
LSAQEEYVNEAIGRLDHRLTRMEELSRESAIKDAEMAAYIENERALTRVLQAANADHDKRIRFLEREHDTSQGVQRALLFGVPSLISFLISVGVLMIERQL